MLFNYLLLSFKKLNNKSSTRAVSYFSLINLFLNSTNPFIIIPDSAWSKFTHYNLLLTAKFGLGGTYQLEWYDETYSYANNTHHIFLKN